MHPLCSCLTSKPYWHFRRSGSNKNSKNSASPEQWSKQSVRTLFWRPLLNPRAYSQYSFSKKFVKELECGITNKAIHNLSSYSLTYHDSKLSGLGLNFIPPSQPPQTQQLEDFQNFARELHLRWCFRNRHEPHLPFGSLILIGIFHRFMFPLGLHQIYKFQSRTTSNL